MSTLGGPPCQAACPVFTDVRGYVLAIAREIAEISEEDFPDLRKRLEALGKNFRKKEKVKR
jgi:hypothetical protein